PLINLHHRFLIFFNFRHTPTSTLFPYTTLFRSKEYNPWLLKNSLTVEEGKSFIILVPHKEIGIAEPEKIKRDSIVNSSLKLKKIREQDSLDLIKVKLKESLK